MNNYRIQHSSQQGFEEERMQELRRHRAKFSEYYLGTRVREGAVDASRNG